MRSIRTASQLVSLCSVLLLAACVQPPEADIPPLPTAYLALFAEGGTEGTYLQATVTCGEDFTVTDRAPFVRRGHQTRADLAVGEIPAGLCTIRAAVVDEEGVEDPHCLPTEEDAVIEGGQTTVVEVLLVCGVDEPGNLLLRAQICLLDRVGSPTFDPSVALFEGEQAEVRFQVQRRSPEPYRLDLRVADPAEAGLVGIAPVAGTDGFQVTCQAAGPAASDHAIALELWLNQCGVNLVRQRGYVICYPVWNAGPTLAFGRNEVRAVRLPSGQVLVAGGFAVDPERTLNEVWLLDPVTESWRQVASLNEPRHGGSLTVLPDGRVIYVGGYRHLGEWLASAEIYDPRTDTWSYTNPPAHHGSGHAAVMLAGGLLLVAGGGPGACQVTDQVSLFDFRTDRWTVGAAIPDGGRGSLGQALVALPDGQALFVPGPAFTCPETQRSLSYLYDPATNRWTPAGETVQGLHFISLIVLPDGRVLKVGGTDMTGRVLPLTELWEPAARTWRQVADLSVPRHYGTVAWLPDGTVLAAGGATSLDGLEGVLAAAEQFDPVTETWFPAPALPQPRMLHATVTLDDGRLVLIGGGDRVDGSWRLWEQVVYYGP